MKKLRTRARTILQLRKAGEAVDGVDCSEGEDRRRVFDFVASTAHGLPVAEVVDAEPMQVASDLKPLATLKANLRELTP